MDGFHDVEMCIAQNLVVGCLHCSFFFAVPEDFLGLCRRGETGLNIFANVENVLHKDGPPAPRNFSAIVNGGHENLYLFLKEANNDHNAEEILNVPQEIRLTLVPIYCSDCYNECGWEIVTVPDHPVLRAGQFIIIGSLLRGDEARRAKRRRRN